MILIFIFSISAEGGTRWELFAETKGIRFYIDKESINHPSKNLVKVWVKAVPNIPFKIGGKYIIYQLEYEEHDCKENKFLFLHVTSYYSDGTIEDVFSEPSEWIDVVTLSTIFKEKHGYFCRDRELSSGQNGLQHQILQ